MPRLDIAVRGLLAAPVAAVAVPDASARVNGPGEDNISHHHPASFWSGTYYIDDGGCAEDPALGGAADRVDGMGAADRGYGIGAAGRGDG